MHQKYLKCFKTFKVQMTVFILLVSQSKKYAVDKIAYPIFNNGLNNNFNNLFKKTLNKRWENKYKLSLKYIYFYQSLCDVTNLLDNKRTEKIQNVSEVILYESLFDVIQSFTHVYYNKHVYYKNMYMENAEIILTVTTT